MKRKLLFLVGVMCLFVVSSKSMSPVYNTTLISETALAVNKTPALDLNALGIDYITFTLAATSSTIPSQTFTDGSPSTGIVTVVTQSGLGSLQASDQLTVIQSTWLAGVVGTEKITVSATAAQIAGSFAVDSMTIVATNDSIIGASITVNGTILLGGRDFTTGVASSNTALSLANAINSNTSINQYVFASTSATGSTIISSATVVGKFGNSFTLSSSTPTVISTGTPAFAGGVDPCFKNAIMTINGYNWENGVNINFGNTSTAAATAIAGTIDLIGNITSSNTGNGTIVFSSATQAGSWINSYGVSFSTPVFVVNTASFTGGVDPALNAAILTINGIRYENGDQWVTTDTSSGTATSIANLFGTIKGTTATAVGSVIFATATTAGAAGNAFTLVTSTVAMSVQSANFTGGRDNATLTVNGVPLQAGAQWTISDVSSNTARSISNAIQANASLAALISSTFTTGGVVTATSAAIGLTTNYSWSSSTSALTVSNTGLFGGTSSPISSGSAVMTIIAHKLTTGLGVLYSTSSSTGITGLTNQTTYFTFPITVNTFSISDTSTGAVAGIALTPRSQSFTGPHTFTLAPLATSGPISMKWEVSNDSSTWVGLNVSSFTLLTPYTSSTTAWDLGNLNWRYLRANTVAPTQGGANLVLTGNGKHSNP